MIYPQYRPDRIPVNYEDALRLIREQMERQFQASPLVSGGGVPFGLPSYTARYTATPEVVALPKGPTPTGDVRLTSADAELAARMETPSASYREYPGGPMVVPSGERERLATGTPNEILPRTGYEKASDAYRTLLETPIEDTNGRLGSALYMAGQRPAHINNPDSLGEAVGARIGQAVSGLVDKRSDERIKHQGDLAEAGDVLKTEGEIDKAERDRREQEADITNKELLPGYKTQEQQRKEEDSKNRASDQRRRVLASVYNKMEEFDPEDPANADFMSEAREAGLPVVVKKRGQQVKVVQDAKTGGWYSIASDKGTGASTSSTVTAPGGGQLSTTSPQQMNAEQQEQNRQSREKIAKWQIDSRAEIAAQNRAIQKERLQVTQQNSKRAQQQFEAKYPGYGKPPLSKDYIIKKAASLNMLPEDVAKDAVGQGFTIED